MQKRFNVLNGVIFCAVTGVNNGFGLVGTLRFALPTNYKLGI
jgi:hypothetical protein